MSDTQPILFYDLVAKKGVNAPLFSPATIRARLAFALKGVPIETVEVTYEDLLATWKDKLEVELATVPFIQIPDGSLLMDSYAIIDWLEDAYPDRPSSYLPTATSASPDALAARATGTADLDAFRDKIASFQLPFSFSAFALYAPLILPTFSEATQAYWICDERMGPGGWQEVLDKDQGECITAVRSGAAELAALLSPTKLFFQSPTKPGFKDFLVMGPLRMIAATSRSNVERTYLEGGFGPWVGRMEAYFAAELADVLARDPK